MPIGCRAAPWDFVLLRVDRAADNEKARPKATRVVNIGAALLLLLRPSREASQILPEAQRSIESAAHLVRLECQRISRGLRTAQSSEVGNSSLALFAQIGPHGHVRLDGCARKRQRTSKRLSLSWSAASPAACRLSSFALGSCFRRG